MKYVVEYQMGGEVEIDLEGTDWLPEEIDSQVSQALDSAAEAPADRIAEEFEDCEVNGEPATAEYSLRRVS